jgi:2-C-methyl-D-erythritol 2,4-cyclodiphosphate synthase
MNGKTRAGIGYDAHKFTEGSGLVLGGVKIPFTKKLDGWSDADLLTHAIIDALLGAAALGDIGSHFPPGEAPYKDISSLVLLEKVKKELAANGWRVVNIDATILAERPRMRDFIERMRRTLSRTLGIDVSRVSIKASTSNGLGFIGRGEGIAAQAIALIEGGKDEGI